MSRPRSQAARKAAGFPRVSGDEPALMLADFQRDAFSPRERG